MKTARHTYIYILAAAVFIWTPLLSSAPDEHKFVASIVNAHSIAESVELVTTLLQDSSETLSHDSSEILSQDSSEEVSPIQPGDRVKWTYIITNTRGAVVGEVSVMAPAGGFAKVTFFPQMGNSGERVLFAKYGGGETVIIGIVDSGIAERISYKVNVYRSKWAVSPDTRENRAIPASVGASLTSSTFNTGTGLTTGGGTLLQTINFHT
jgi:hypothetical protein